MLWTRRQFCVQALAAATAIPTAETLDALVRNALRAWKVPGAAVAIVRDDRTEYLAGHGVRAAGEKAPVTPATLFPLGSCTKGFTTAALALLADAGKLAWDDPVRKHVPFFRLSDPLADARVTLADLLCHRTGLATHDLLWYRAPWKPAESVRRAGFLPLEKPFRTAFQYQSTMFTAAGLAVESASGQKWEEFVERRLFVPQGMKTAGCSDAVFKTEDRATGHDLSSDGEARRLPEWCPCPRPDAAYTIHASAADLCGWLRLQLDPQHPLVQTHEPRMVVRLGGHERRLHPESTQSNYGFGWLVQDHHGWKIVGHSGVLEGFRVQLTLVPKAKLGIAVLANLNATRMNLALSYVLLDRLLGIEGRDWHTYLLKEMRSAGEESARAQRERMAARHEGTRPSRGLSAYAGDYDHPAYGKARVALERGRLVLHWGAFDSPLDHVHYDTFSAEIGAFGSCLLTFALDASTRVNEMSAASPFGVTFRR